MKTCLLAVLLLALPFDALPQTLHAIMVSDLEDPKLGGISLSDEATILEILKTAESGTGLKLKTYHHNRSSFTAKAVRETMNQMRVGNRDVVFFYYTGLGYYPGQKDKFPTFKLKENALRIFLNNNLPLSLDEVGGIVQDKGARLNIVMADCRDTAEELMTYGRGTILDEDMREVILKKLFLGSCGLVKVAGAGKGKLVWANQGRWGTGSVFTENFTSNFKGLLEAQFNGVRQATWPQILENTQSIYIDPRKDGIPSSTQKAVHEMKACSASQRRRTTQYATYEYSITAGGIGEKLENYVKDGGDYEKISNEISRAFSRNAKINLVQKNKYPTSHPQAKKIEEEMSVADFLEQFKGTSAQIKAVDIDFSNLKRTPNKEYLTILTIIETYDEL